MFPARAKDECLKLADDDHSGMRMAVFEAMPRFNSDAKRM